QGDRPRVHPRLRGGGGEARRREVPRAGHPVLRRHRVRRRHGRVDDQVPPQRGRPARRPAVRARRAAARTLQGRGPRRRRRARPARAPGLAPAVSRPRPRDPDRRRRGDEGAPGPPARVRLHPAGRDPRRRSVSRPVAVLLRPARHPHGRGAGRRAHVRKRRRDPCRHVRRRDDGRLGAPALRPARADRVAHDQRAARRQPRRAGHHVQAAGHDRVGV
ncbi:MAG: GMP synthase [glutamine-hydrolyzing], amidotransferase subunit / GMP synthase [glutamine-hydrolyzing], ATP pyrophosphatase subunit, partial [uncultured Solirubrobacteraceae bacterium]